MDLAQRCFVGGFRRGAITVRVANNPTAAKLQWHLPSLLAGFKEMWPDVSAVKVEVQLRTQPTSGTLQKNRSVIAPPAAPLDQLADSLPASRLRDAIASLARKGRR